MPPIVSLILAATLLNGCAAPELIILPAPPVPAGTLQVTVSDDAISDPLPVQGAGEAYANLKPSVRGAVEAAAADWDARHVAAPGWDMRVNLVGAHARARQGQRSVDLSAEVSLFTLRGHAFIGQTRLYCRASLNPSEGPSKPIADCIASLARDIAVWLEHVPP